MLKQHYQLSLSLMFSRKVMILKIGEYKNLTTSRYSRVQNYKLSKTILSFLSLSITCIYAKALGKGGVVRA